MGYLNFSVMGNKQDLFQKGKQTIKWYNTLTYSS